MPLRGAQYGRNESGRGMQHAYDSRSKINHMLWNVSVFADRR